MLASTFQPKPGNGFGFLTKTVLSVLFYGVIWPLSKILAPLGRWPSLPHIDTYATTPAVTNYRPSASDVFVCSYFKSGTTWLMQVVTQIAFKGQADFENIHHAVPWTEMPKFSKDWAIPLDDASPAQLSPTGLRAIKTHFAWPLVPKSPEARYIAMVRDPKGVVESGYHFIKAMALGPTMPSFRVWARKFLQPDFFEGTWGQHVASYWAHRNAPNMLFMTYEELRADLGAGIDKIAAFMGVDLTAEERAAVIERSSYASMKKNARKFDYHAPMPWSKTESMVRDGGSGQGKKLLTPEIARQVDDYFRAELRALGCDFDYDAAFRKG